MKKMKQLISVLFMITITLIIFGTVCFTKKSKNDSVEKEPADIEPLYPSYDDKAYLNPSSEDADEKIAKQEVTDNLVKDIEQEAVEETSYSDNLDHIYVGEKDKELFTELLRNSEKVIYYEIDNAPGLLCHYAISIGDIELGYKSSIIYENDERVYIFWLASDDEIKLNEWIEGLEVHDSN